MWLCDLQENVLRGISLIIGMMGSMTVESPALKCHQLLVLCAGERFEGDLVDRWPHRQLHRPLPASDYGIADRHGHVGQACSTKAGLPASVVVAVKGPCQGVPEPAELQHQSG